LFQPVGNIVWGPFEQPARGELHRHRAGREEDFRLRVPHMRRRRHEDARSPSITHVPVLPTRDTD
jgi:hypothetical protein